MILPPAFRPAFTTIWTRPCKRPEPTSVFYGGLPFYNKLFHDSGFETEAAQLADGQGQGATANMADELSVIGPPARCREQLAAFREAGIQLPILNPVPVGDQTYAQAVQQAIETFAQWTGIPGARQAAPPIALAESPSVRRPRKF